MNGKMNSCLRARTWIFVAGTVHIVTRCHYGNALLHPLPKVWIGPHISKTFLHATNVAEISVGNSKNRRRRGGKYQSGGNKGYPSNLPWDADFVTSRHTQTKIQAAAAKAGCLDPVQCAQTILQFLLDTPSNECNPANIVCALTLSAKTLAATPVQQTSKGGHVSDEFRQSLTETLGILQMLVDDKKLSPRQLCNAAWAIAKHFDVIAKGFGENDVDVSQSIDQVLNSIALRMIDHLQKIRGGHQNGGNKHVQTGELSMLLWAYAVAKPRELPPGWERPRRFEQLVSDEEKPFKKKSRNKNREDHLVTFVSVDNEQFDNLSCEEEVEDDKNQVRSSTSRLFDAAAIAFCRGEGAAVLQSTGTSLIKNCTWNELSNIAWSYATRGAYGTKQSDAMMTFLAREATRRLNYAMSAPPILTGGKKNKYCKVLPRDVVQIAWALGIMESDNISTSVENALIHLVDAINEYWIANGESNENYRQLRYWKSADLVQLASALAHGRLNNQSVLTAIYEESRSRLCKSTKNKQAFSASELSILLWTQARLNLTKKYGLAFEEFPGLACKSMLNQMSVHGGSTKALQQIGLYSQEQANLAWSLTVLNQFDDHIILFLQSIFTAASSQTEGTMQLEHAHQLWQALFILSDDCPDAVKHVPSDLSQYLKRKWNIEKGRSKQSSYRHKAISRTLELLGVAHQNEYKEDVDVAIVLKDASSFISNAQLPINDSNEKAAQRKIAVEFDGPHHFTMMASTGEDLSLIENGVKLVPRVLGHTVLKYRMLKKKNWTVIRIPWYEWDKIPHWASMERQRYLQRCLKTHQEIQFSDVDVSQYQALPATRQSRFD